MKQVLFVLFLLVAACQVKRERFIREASAFSNGYVGHWEAVLPGTGSQVFQAGVSIEPSGDSLLWTYFSQIVDTTTKKKYLCGPIVTQMPVWWDDSLQVVQANHGVGQGYGFDVLRVTATGQLQVNSPSLASSCRGPGGFNASQVLLSKVTTFRYQP
ncbi:hypothetical protein BN8_p06792 (plasmid) [Fibrisoma limi BUZ 3]|uniref:Uncharacterized protein n=1 Tax=Fibrisoma limi BUZ 3 TaxID=1185876 RepID=I2GTZ7_9BACT|nr:hypothetical protein [Fibrisoma limi]CCH57598.1 hypothetical protein BN8_p06792 [Fibrisoma limi BUZ 3]